MPENRSVLNRSKWEDNIKMDVQQVGFGEWNGSSWLRIRTIGGDL
jgi:hypothetical protein